MALEIDTMVAVEVDTSKLENILASSVVWFLAGGENEAKTQNVISERCMLAWRFELGGQSGREDEMTSQTSPHPI
jgi:hypothetical protein